MVVEELWRYPVKSMGGERLEVADVDAWGIDGDRQWAVIDVATGYGLTAKREPELLYAGAAVVDGEVMIMLDGGVTLTGAGTATDAVLSDWLGRPVTLRRASRDTAATFEIAADFEAGHEAKPLPWGGAQGTVPHPTPPRASLAAPRG